jgi:hypothetical protein
VNVKLFHPTYFATVSGALALLVAVVHAIADGKVASAGGVTVGYAINAGTTNDIIEIAVQQEASNRILLWPTLTQTPFLALKSAKLFSRRRATQTRFRLSDLKCSDLSVPLAPANT